MKLGFITCVQLGLSCMEAIYRVGAELSLVMTLPDDHARSKSGRVYLDDFCSQHAIPLIKSSHVNNPDVVEAIRSANLDWVFIIGWSQIASTEILLAPKHGVLGIHPTLLPEGRGRAAVPWAILKSLDRTGVTLFKMDEGVDTGPIATQIEIQLSSNTTASELYDQVEAAHIELIEQVIPLILQDHLILSEQNHDRATIWPGRKPEDGKINLLGSVFEAERLVRAVTHPYPGAYYDHGNTRNIIWNAEIASNDSAVKDPCLRFADGVLLIKNVSKHEIAS